MLHTVFSQCLLIELMQIWFGLRWRMRTVLTAHKGKVDTKSDRGKLLPFFKHCVSALCRCWQRGPATTPRTGRAPWAFTCNWGLQPRVTRHVSRHVSRVTRHVSRVTPWYVSPAWHWNGPAVLVAAQDNDGASKAGKRRDQGRSWTPFFVSGG